MQQSNQDDSTIMHITIHTETEKLPLFGHIINSIFFVCKINLQVIQEYQTLVLPLFLHFGGYIYGIKFLEFNHVRLWRVNLYVHNISHYHVQFNVTISWLTICIKHIKILATNIFVISCVQKLNE